MRLCVTGSYDDITDSIIIVLMTHAQTRRGIIRSILYQSIFVVIYRYVFKTIRTARLNYIAFLYCFLKERQCVKFTRSCKYYKGLCSVLSRLLKNNVISNKTGYIQFLILKNIGIAKNIWISKRQKAKHRYDTRNNYYIASKKKKKITKTPKKYRQISFSFFTVRFLYAEVVHPLLQVGFL